MAAPVQHDDPTAALDSHPSRELWRLAWPAVTLNLLQTGNALLDTFFIQGLPSANATAASGSTTSIFLFVSLAFALGIAATALVSRSFGAGERGQMREACRQGVATATVAGLALAALAVLLSPLLASIQIPASNPEAARLMQRYLLGLAAGLPAVFFIQSLAGSLRGIGDTKSPMYISGLQILMHVALNAWWIPLPGHMPFPTLGWGIGGAGAAFAASAWASAAVYALWVRRTPLGAVGVQLPSRDWLRRIARIAGPSAVSAVVRVTSLMAYTFVLKSVPDASYAVAALRPAFSVESLAFMPAFGLSVSVAALVGQCLGAGKPERAERVAWLAAHNAGAVSLAASVVIVVFARPIAAVLMPDQPEIAAIVARFLVFLGSTEVLFAYGMVMLSAMQGAGDTVRPLWLTLATMWGMRVPLAAFAALPWGLGWGADGCWLSMAVTQAVLGLAAMAVFRRGAWKTQRV